MNYTDTVLSTVNDFCSRLGFPQDLQVSANYDPQNDLYQVLVQTANPGPVIGFHGETLSSLQLIIGQHLHRNLGQWLNLSINVNDYRERRETSLKSLADSAVSQVLQTQTPHSLPPMPSSERRIIHLYLAENPDISTSSEGQGRNRYIIISPKNAG